MPAFIASFSVSQSQDGTQLYIVDSSNYTAEGKGTFSARKLYLYLNDGSTMLADGTIVKTTPTTYIDFSFGSYPDDAITIILSKDWGFNMVLALVSNAPQSGSVYTSQAIISLEQFRNSFLQSLTQGSQAQGSIQNDTNYQMNWLLYYMNIKCSENAQEFQVLSSIQNAIDRDYTLSNAQTSNF